MTQDELIIIIYIVGAIVAGKLFWDVRKANKWNSYFEMIAMPLLCISISWMAVGLIIINVWAQGFQKPKYLNFLDKWYK